jgi:hypothetical protein
VEGLGLHLFVRDFPDDNAGELQNAIYLSLDNALGEFDVVTNIAWIEWGRLPPAPRHSVWRRWCPCHGHSIAR